MIPVICILALTVRYDRRNGVGTARYISICKKVYGTVPEYLWEHHPAYAALRMSTSKECYAVLKREDYGENEILEVQYDPAVMGSLVKIQGLLPDRNAEDGNWVSIPLDGSVSEATVLDFWTGAMN